MQMVGELFFCQSRT